MGPERVKRNQKQVLVASTTLGASLNPGHSGISLSVKWEWFLIAMLE